MSAAPLLVVLKSHVRAYQRTTKTGKVVQVHEHEDARMRHAQPAAGSQGPRAPASSGPGMGHNGGPPMEDKPARAASQA